MFNITGKILNKETGVGVPDLLVVIFDVDNFKDEDVSQSPSVERTAPASTNSSWASLSGIINSNADRLGSVVTDAKGYFAFEIQHRDFNTGNEKEQKPDVVLAVLTHEEPGLKIEDRLLYLSNDFRINVGRNEAYLIKLSNELLKKHGVEILQNKIIEDRISKYKKTISDEKAYSNAVNSIEKTEVLKKQNNMRVLKKQLQPILTPKPIIESNFSTFVSEDEKVSAKLPAHNMQELAKANRTIAAHVAQNKGIEVSFVLNKLDREQLQLNIATENIKSFTDIRNAEPLKSLLYKMNSAGADNLVLTSNNPILKKCLSKSDDTLCASIGVGLTSEQSHSAQESKQLISFSELPEPAKNHINGNNGGESNVVAILKIKDSKEIIRYEARLLANIVLYFDHSGISTNEAIPLTQEDIATEVKKVITDARSIKNSANKPSPDSVNENINKFSLKKGPAELASFYDFKVLNIAFGDIWQQLVDDTPVQLAAEVKNHAINRGFNLSDIYSSPSQMMAEFNFIGRMASNPPPEVTSNFDITYEEWNALDNDSQPKLRHICVQIDKINDILINSSFRSDRLEKLLQSFKEQGELLIDYVRAGNVKSFHKILTELDCSLKSNYAFNIFGADETAKAINFGLLNTFRQEWTPVAYQVGDLVKSIPLSPKEERKYSLKTTFTRKHTEKESKKNNTSLTQEQNTTSRAEEEIVAKAQSKSNFNLSAGFESSKWKVSSSLGLDSEKESSQNKKDFRESVLKATQEFKEERSLEIDTEETYSSEYNESGTIINPNDELAVTYLFYELQKRFKVSEQLYRVMPVVLVAQDVPTPSEITEAWIITHDWILNRALLDDSFRPALQYIAQKNVGDDYAIRELRKNLRTQRQLIDTLKRELASLNAEADNRYVGLEAAINAKNDAQEEQNKDGVFEGIGEWFAGKSDDPETKKAREMAARDAHAYAAEKAQKMALNLQREVSALQSVTADYTKAMRDHLDKKTMVERLLLHIKSNIIYYMQAIWSMEPPDQRYMRLLNVKVPQFEITQMDCDIKQKPELDLFEDFRNNAPEVEEKLHKAWLRPTIEQSPEDKSLVEIADLDTALGFKGNYMVFPMKRHNAITEIMAMPYVDASFGAMDPDQLSNISLEDFSHYVCCLRKELTESEFDKKIKTLKHWLEMLLADPLRNGDEIIVPTNSLYIEMMVSANSLLEDFKLQHREWDVYKVQEEVQMQALENLRMAKRILTGQLEDPKIDKKIVVEGKVGTNIDVDHV